MRSLASTCLSILIAAGCASRPQVESAAQALRQTDGPVVWQDDLGFANLKAYLKDHVDYFRERNSADIMVFGPITISREEYFGALTSLLEDSSDEEEFYRILNRDWTVLEVYGREDYGEVLVTSYYDPEIRGALRPTEELSEPLYRLPDDMVIIDFDQFLETQPRLKLSSDMPFEQKSRFRILRGRLNQENQKVVPYYSREQIVGERVLAGRNLEIAWVDPVDAFFIQIQGSGRVIFDDAVIRVGYAGQNGHPYEAIGRHMLDVIPKEKMSMQRIRTHLNSVDPEEKNRIMNINASYVFFQELTGDAVTYSGIEVMAGRSIATDYNLFPKGALAFLETEVPEFAGDEIARWRPISRFVLDHDTGGAIRGPGRLDLYWGSGQEAAQHAGVMKQAGRLYYLVPRTASSSR